VGEIGGNVKLDTIIGFDSSVSRQHQPGLGWYLNHLYLFFIYHFYIHLVDVLRFYCDFYIHLVDVLRFLFLQVWLYFNLFFEPEPTTYATTTLLLQKHFQNYAMRPAMRHGQSHAFTKFENCAVRHVYTVYTLYQNENEMTFFLPLVAVSLQLRYSLQTHFFFFSHADVRYVDYDYV